MKNSVLKNSATTIAVIAVAVLLAVATGCDKGKTVSEISRDTDLSKASDIFDGNPATAVESKKPLEPTTVIAIVNGTNILFSDIQNDMRSMFARMNAQPNQALQQQLPKILSQAVQNRIDSLLMEKAVSDENISVADSDVEKELRQIAASAPNDEKLVDALSKRGVTIEEFRNDLAKNMRTKKLIDLKTAEVAEATDEDAEKYYKANNTRFIKPETATAKHILIGFTKDDDAAAKKGKLEKINELRTQIVENNADFSELAKKYSSCPSSAQGGSLGTFRRGQMVKDFDEVAFTLPIGEVSKPVETRFGYHLILVEKRDKAEVIPFEEVSDKLKEFLTMQKKEKFLTKYIKKLRADSDVKILQDLSRTKVSLTQMNPEK